MMTYMLIRHKVKDVTLWKEVYEANIALRVKNGLTEKYVLQDDGDPPEVILLFEAEKDPGKGRGFLSFA